MKLFINLNLNSKLQFLIVIAIVLVLYSCKKKEQYPIEPHIEFLDFTQITKANGIDSAGIFKFSFTDGDGDIGLNPEDTLAPYNAAGQYYYNFFIKYYELQNGVLKEVPLAWPNNSRIPNITPDGKNKSINGEIEMAIRTFSSSSFDTIMFDAKIVDRALHESNTIQTNYIVLKKH